MAFSHSVQLRIQKERPLPPPLTKHTRACPREQLSRHLRENFNVAVSLLVFTYTPYLCVANFSSLFRIRCHISSIHAAAKVSNQPTNDRSKRLSTACAKFQLCELCFIDDGPTRKFYLSRLLYLYGRRVRNWLLPLEHRQWHHRGMYSAFEKRASTLMHVDTNHPLEWLLAFTALF
jgi:hypothetical protein